MQFEQTVTTALLRQCIAAITLTIVALSTDAQELVSVANDQSQGDSRSHEASISANGRFVAFDSNASNFAAGDLPPPANSFDSSTADIFVADLQTGELELISVGLDGLPANTSLEPAISGNGRYVVFRSRATNLVANDTNDEQDIFFVDRETQSLERINLAPDGSEADGQSDEVAISEDGRFVAFESVATNLVSGDTNEIRDIFVWARETGVMERVSIAHDGSQSDRASDKPSLSADGRFVVFESQATNLVPGDTNMRRDIFLFDRELQQIERIDISADGTQSDGNSEIPTVSSDGRFVAFDSRSTNLVAQQLSSTGNVFVKDRQSGALELISQSTNGVPADGFCQEAAMSANGRFLTFDCPGTTLVDDDTQGIEHVYLYDRADRSMTLVSTAAAGQPGNARSYRPSLSVDAVAFSSIATNLVLDDDNENEDVFVVYIPLFLDDFEPPSSQK